MKPKKDACKKRGRPREDHVDMRRQFILSLEAMATLTLLAAKWECTESAVLRQILTGERQIQWDHK